LRFLGEPLLIFDFCILINCNGQINWIKQEFSQDKYVITFKSVYLLPYIKLYLLLFMDTP
jgi:hypothetical protein